MLGRVLPLALLAIALLAAACADEASAPTHTPEGTTTGVTASPILTVSPIASPSVISPAAIDDFRQFAAQIAYAIDGRDGEFFANRGVEINVECHGDEQVGQCSSIPVPTILRGIPGGAWASDAFGVIPKEEYAVWMSDWWNTSVAASDRHGQGDPRLFAIAFDSSGQALSIQTLIALDAQTQEQERQVRIQRWNYEDSSWRLVGETTVFYQQGSEDWLSGTCSGCYDYFELWQGAPQ